MKTKGGENCRRSSPPLIRAIFQKQRAISVAAFGYLQQQQRGSFSVALLNAVRYSEGGKCPALERAALHFSKVCPPYCGKEASVSSLPKGIYSPIPEKGFPLPNAGGGLSRRGGRNPALKGGGNFNGHLFRPGKYKRLRMENATAKKNRVFYKGKGGGSLWQPGSPGFLLKDCML